MEIFIKLILLVEYLNIILIKLTDSIFFQTTQPVFNFNILFVITNFNLKTKTKYKYILN